jgi:hypothetical protein
LFQELAGVRGERFHVPALALGIDGIEGQAGFARSGQAGDDHQPIPGDFDIHVLEIMFAGAADHDVGLSRHIFSRARGWV